MENLEQTRIEAKEAIERLNARGVYGPNYQTVVDEMGEGFIGASTGHRLAGLYFRGTLYKLFAAGEYYYYLSQAEVDNEEAAMTAPTVWGRVVRL